MDLLLGIYEQITQLEAIYLIGLVSGVSMLIGILIGLIMIPTLKKVKPTLKKVPNFDYGVLDTTRSKTEFDMDDEEIKEFLDELKAQINEEIPEIEKYLNNQDWINLKNSVHKIKGSAVNLGENGIAKLLFDFNHYLSEGNYKKKILIEMLEDIKYYKEKMY